MQDLTNYSQHEMSLRVFNEEDIYQIRHDEDLLEILKGVFIWTDEQVKQLIVDLEEDQEDE